jgi:glycosyltransferase involved in cell wall biosynthesis
MPPHGLVVIVPFLDEARHLPRSLRSIATQTRQPDLLILVDDGSVDGSAEIARAFAGSHAWVRLLRRPARARTRDRLAAASEWSAFIWALEEAPSHWSVAAKVDADIDFPPCAFSVLERLLSENPRLGLAGTYLREAGSGGNLRRLRIGPGHVHGATKFYKRECWDQISPIPAMLGWDSIDEIRARMCGWDTRSFELPGGDPIHLRPRASQDGFLRGQRRLGTCSWVIGEHPVAILATGVRLMVTGRAIRPGLNYLAGWALGFLRRTPRAETDMRAHVRAAQLARARRRLLRATPE